MDSGKWGVVGAAASLSVMLSETGNQVGAIQTANSRAYGTGTLTGPTMKFWDTEMLRGALEFWIDTENAPAARALLNWHAGLDLAFLCLVAALAWWMLTALRVPERRRRAAIVTYLVADLAETLLTLVVVNVGHPTWLLVLLQFLTLMKWLALADVALLAVTSPTVRSGFSVRVFLDAPGVPARAALFGQWVLVATFAAFIALPGGGPLEQLPDILRQQLADHLRGTFLWGTLCVIGLTAALVVSGAIGLRAAAPGPPTERSWSVLAVGFAITAVLTTVHLVLEGWSPVTLAPAIVFGVVQLLAWWRDRFAPAPPPSTTVADGTPPTTSEPGSPTAPTVVRLGGLGGAVALVAALGLVRATAPYLVLGLPGIRWWVFCVFGVVTATMSVGTVRFLLGQITPRLDVNARTTIMTVAPIATLVAAGGLAVAPGKAWLIGANGVFAVWLSLAAMVVAGFQLLARRAAVWTATRSLGLGQRTPWTLLAVAVYVVASLLNTSGGYHDVRVVTATATDEALTARYTYASVGDAVEGWLAARDVACADRNGSAGGDEPVPLVVVAAPGGGIRAALWTAAGLDTMFPTECARSSLFAISGASGGSVGATVWQAAPKDGASATDAVTAMSGPEPLAAGLAAMLMRDLPQPLTGLDRQWNDRAAIIEDQWVEASQVLGTTSEPELWSTLRSERGWTPVLVLNASSVTDGCRIVIANTANLPTATSGDCTSPTEAGGGPISGAIDPLATLRDVDGGERGVCASGELTAVGAAMLSARFPFVTPSGSLHTCPIGTGPGTTPKTDVDVYAVDGGYIENSGILAAIELVDEIAAGPHTDRVEPWIVVLDNHYRSVALPPAPNRPKEFVVPIEAVRNKPGLSQVVLEQMAAERLWDPTMSCPRLIRVGPAVRPDLSAPLGWTLSTDTVDRLLDSMAASLTSLSHTRADASTGVEADTCSSDLLGFLDVSIPGRAGADG